MKWTVEDENLLKIVRENLAELTEEARLSLEQSQAEDANSGTARLTEITPFVFNIGHKAEKESSSMSENTSFLTDLEKKTSEAKRIATVAHPLAADLVHQTVQEDHDARIEARIAERADTTAKVPEVLEKCQARGDGLTFRESDRDFAQRWNDGLRLQEQQEQALASAKGIASSIATLGV